MGTKELPGNNGIFDMTLAVNWVKDYIKYFGGNPKQIIAFGHGTGASSAFMLTLSKLSRSKWFTCNVKFLRYLKVKEIYILNF